MRRIEIGATQLRQENAALKRQIEALKAAAPAGGAQATPSTETK